MNAFILCLLGKPVPGIKRHESLRLIFDDDVFHHVIAVVAEWLIGPPCTTILLGNLLQSYSMTD